MVQSQVVLVGGGTGFVGRHLVNRLRSDGAKVRVITRKHGNSPDHVSWDTIKSKGIPSGTTAVVNLAGRNIFDSLVWTENSKKEIYTSRIDTTRILVEAIHRAPVKPRVFVSASGVGYYEPSETVEYDEDWTQPEPKSGSSAATNFWMELAKDWEMASELDEKEAPNTRRVIIRPGAVIGHDGGMIPRLLLPFKLGLGGPFGDGKQWFPWIHIDDIANMFKFSIINDHVTGVVNGVAPEQVRNKDFAQTFAQSLNRPSLLPMPGFAVKLLFGSERAEMMLTGQRVKSRAPLLGFRCQYPTLHEACQQIAKAK